MLAAAPVLLTRPCLWLSSWTGISAHAWPDEQDWCSGEETLHVLCVTFLTAPAYCKLHQQALLLEATAGCHCCCCTSPSAGNGQPGYLDDPTVPAGSRAPTYAACRLQIKNERWAGVPFVLRAGKALNERSVVVRIQLHPNPVPLFGQLAAHQEMRNEFVMRLQPGEAHHAARACGPKPAAVCGGVCSGGMGRLQLSVVVLHCAVLQHTVCLNQLPPVLFSCTPSAHDATAAGLV